MKIFAIPRVERVVHEDELGRAVQHVDGQPVEVMITTPHDWPDTYEFRQKYARRPLPPGRYRLELVVE